MADHPEQKPLRGKVAYWNFLPPEELNELLHLYSLVSHKTLRISRTFGIEGKKLLTRKTTTKPYVTSTTFTKAIPPRPSGCNSSMKSCSTIIRALPTSSSAARANFFGQAASARGGGWRSSSRFVFFCYHVRLCRTTAGPPTRWATSPGQERPARSDGIFTSRLPAKVVEEPTQIAALIRIPPETPRHCTFDKETLTEIRAKIERHIRNTYMKSLQAPANVKPCSRHGWNSVEGFTRPKGQRTEPRRPKDVACRPQPISLRHSSGPRQKDPHQRVAAGALEWPHEEDAEKIDDIGYGWSQDDLRISGLERQILDGQVWQIQPFRGDQPWGIFLLEFNRPDFFGPRGALSGATGTLRKILRGLVPSRRGNPALRSWQREHLLFLCTHDYSQFRFAYFKAPRDTNLAAPLTFFGWNNGDTHIRTLCEHNLPALLYDTDLSAEEWLRRWTAAFDVEAVTKRFFAEYAAVFHQVEEGIKGVSGGRASAPIHAKAHEQAHVPLFHPA